jgi:hypothetical protein
MKVKPAHRQQLRLRAARNPMRRLTSPEEEPAPRTFPAFALRFHFAAFMEKEDPIPPPSANHKPDPKFPPPPEDESPVPASSTQNGQSVGGSLHEMPNLRFRFSWIRWTGPLRMPGHLKELR